VDRLIETVEEALTSAEFLGGLRWGLLAFAAGTVLVLFWRRSRATVAPIVGLLLTLAVVLAMPAVRPVPGGLLQGAALLGAAGLVAQIFPRSRVWSPVLAAPGAWWLAFQSSIPGGRWVPWFVFGVIVIGGALAADFDRRYERTGLAALFLLMTIGGALLTLPDTEEILVLLGAAVPVVILAWPKALASLGFGTFPFIGILMWVIASGGRGRAGSIVGAAACLGVLLSEPLAAAVSRRPRILGALALGLLHTGQVFIGARVAGIGSDPWAAASIAGVALTAGAVGCWAATRKSTHEYVS
jgi:hypothetical protein